MSAHLPWYDRFFSHEYLAFDDHPHTALEVDFLHNVLSLPPNARLLDLGCGYGRHAIPLAQKNLTVVGLDRSPVLIAKAQSLAQQQHEAPVFLRADVRAIPFFETFDAVISMFSSLGYFEDENENFLVLQNIADTLSPGGKLLIETANRDFIIRHNLPVQVYHPEGVLLIEEREFDALTSRSLVDVTIVQNGEETHLHHSIRLYTPTELDMLLASVGLATIAVWGDFHGDDLTIDSPHLILLAEKM